jgi:hypothetical protein
MRNPTRQVFFAVFLVCETRVWAFAPPNVRRYSERPSQHSYQAASASSGDDDTTTTIQAKHALLISSFSDGILKSQEAQEFLRTSLLSSMLQQQTARLEKKVEQSVLVSPCNGPDPAAWQAMEEADKLLASGNLTPDLLEDPVVRLLYIPTAMYALRADSQNSPGKQRQRARADGKTRRTQILKTLTSLLGPDVPIHAVTMDLDDGSIKQPEGSENEQDFPRNGKEALRDWKPHFVYVEGGNTFWLYHCMEKGGWEQDLLAVITGKEAAVYCGKSAGAILGGARMDTATWKGWDDPSVVPGKEKYEAWIDVLGLDILGGSSIFPHMDERWESLVAEKKAGLKNNVYCITDSEVCLVNGEQQTVSVVGSD